MYTSNSPQLDWPPSDPEWQSKLMWPKTRFHDSGRFMHAHSLGSLPNKLSASFSIFQPFSFFFSCSWFCKSDGTCGTCHVVLAHNGWYPKGNSHEKLIVLSDVSSWPQRMQDSQLHASHSIFSGDVQLARPWVWPRKLKKGRVKSKPLLGWALFNF